jgi:hypothetical protein
MTAAQSQMMQGAILRSREDATVIPPAPSEDDATQRAKRDDERCLMAELSIIHGQRHYFYDGHRFDRLSDAVTYAQVAQAYARRARPSATS